MDINLQTKLPKLEPGAIKSQQGAIIEIVLLLVVAGILYWFLVQPKLAQVQAMQTQLQQLQTQRQGVEHDAKTLQVLSQQLSAESTDIEHLDQALPLEERQVRTQLLIEQLVKSSGVLIGNIAINNSSDAVAAGDQKLIQNPYGVGRSLQSVNVAINVSGNFSQLMDLLGKLEHYGRLMDVSSISFSSDAQDASLIAMKLEFVTYYYGPK